MNSLTEKRLGGMEVVSSPFGEAVKVCVLGQHGRSHGIANRLY